ncbi:Signal recognition particle 14 kDa protein isoform B [Glycine soja]|uniref:Signal recognition particle 14 kDa protein n=1 Tax=Glycine soja TaxID=3848 RepID=A0A445J506_GLYSO|nr:Signal recognition particle 14 kDa protein isoform B [Glycine soja]
MFERSTKLGSVWVTLKRSSLKSKVQRNKLATAGEAIEYRCLIRATDGKKTISTSVGMSLNPEYCFNTGAGFENLAWGIATGGEKVGPKDHQRFQASYATILKAHMTALKKRERKDKKKPAEADKREGSSKRLKKS